MSRSFAPQSLFAILRSHPYSMCNTSAKSSSSDHACGSVVLPQALSQRSAKCLGPEGQQNHTLRDETMMTLCSWYGSHPLLYILNGETTPTPGSELNGEAANGDEATLVDER